MTSDYTKPETLTNEELAFALADESESHRIKFGYTGGASLYADLIREAAWRLTHNEKFARKEVLS